MSNDPKFWVHWDSPTKVSAMSVHDLVLAGRPVKPTPKPGGFDFHDGSVQGWTLDQIYDQNESPFQAPLPPGLPGNGPFSLKNHQNLALCAETPFLASSNAGITQCNIYLISPDLSQSTDWQNIVGYAIDVHRTLSSVGMDPKPTQFWCQLQIYLKNLATGATTHLAEAQGPNGPHLFHEVAINQPYHFEWKPPSLNAGDGKLVISKLRIRLTSTIPSGLGAGELPLQGAWLVGNVVPV